MLAILFPIDIVWVPISAVVAAIIGFSFRSSQIIKLKKQVSQLEKEMLSSHAEILNLQQQMVRAQQKNPNTSLVVAMKEVPAQEEKQETHKNVGKRSTAK